MKKLFTFLPALMCAFASQAVTIFSQNFNASTSTPAGWTLMSADNGGTTSTAGNQWLINNVYAAGPLGTATNTQPVGITGGPTSNYLHINCGPTFSGFYGNNCNYNAAGTGETYFTTSTSMVTTGYTGVSLKFWWLCQGSVAANGKVYYRTSSTGTWTAITTPISTYYGSPNWTQQTITMAAFDNQAYLQFAWEFTEDIGSDPAFGIDEILVEGTGGGGPTPVAAMTANHTTVCTDSSVTFTNTSTGTASIDSFTWKSEGVPFGTANTSPVTLFFTTAGTFNVRIYLWDGGAIIDSATQPIIVKQSPHPVVIKTGTTLSVTGTYTSYQWYNGITPIVGATNSSYTYTTPTVYGVMVDSNGCKGIGIKNTVSVNNVNGAGNSFWVAHQTDGSLPLIASSPLDAALKVSVFDATGRNVATRNWDKGMNFLKIDDLNLPSGLYVVRLTNENTNIALRWLRE